jgi:signal transduction histidine kinase
MRVGHAPYPLKHRAIEDANRASEVISSVRAMFGRDHRAKEPLRLNDLIGDVVALVHGELEGHQAGIQLDPQTKILEILGNRMQIQQVLLNLFTNEIEAMESINDRPRTLSIKSELCDPGHILISVGDTGPGIAPQDIDRIFDAFSQPNRAGWVWACPSASRSLKITEATCGLCLAFIAVRRF